MYLDGLTIALRARSPWEATDLGIALIRVHAGRIYAAWILITLPLFVLVNAACYLLGYMLPAVLVLWWLKPAFDRIPLFVISRAVFGATPSLRETLRAQRNWGWRALLPWLTWRRFHPGRALLLPVDLLEGLDRARRRERVRVLGGANASPNVLLTLIGINLESVLALSVWLLALMFVPVEFFTDSAKAMWDTLIDKPPLWAQGLANLVAWLAMSIVEPFYIGAGFGLYLNRRIQLEGWDIELAFRRMAARLLQPAIAIVLLLGAALVFSVPAAHAQERTAATQQTQTDTDSEKPNDTNSEKPKENQKDALPLRSIFGKSYRADAEFVAAMNKVYADGDLAPKETISEWRRRHPLEAQDGKSRKLPWWFDLIGQTLGFVIRYAVWIGLVVLLVVLIMNLQRWMPWISDRFERPHGPDEVGIRDIAVAEALPDDIPSAVRALWQQGRAREALALLYRAGVARLAEALGAPLPPGATEAECLRRARQLQGNAYAVLFARIVRCWQMAAYAQRLPAAMEIESLLGAWVAAPAVAAERAQ
jgi:hypothetical protein